MVMGIDVRIESIEINSFQELTLYFKCLIPCCLVCVPVICFCWSNYYISSRVVI